MTPEQKKFARGYKFNNFEGQPEAKISQLDIPSKVIILLKQGFGDEVDPIVEIGQKVKAGQIIGRDDESISSPIHSSINGEVVAIEKIDYLGEETTAITIESDGNDSLQLLPGASVNWKDLPADKIDELVYLSGAASSGQSGIPTTFNSASIMPDEVENVIVQGVASQVHNVSLEVLLKGDILSHFTAGLKILKKLMPKARFHMVLDESQNRTISKALQLMSPVKTINVFTVPRKYPLHRDEVLTELLVGQKIPHGYLAANIGAIVLDLPAVLAVYDAVTGGIPLIERTIALCGAGFRENTHVKARIGTSLEDILKNRTKPGKDIRLVKNSCLTGNTLTDMSLPVSRTFSSIIALTEGTEREFLSFVRPGINKDSFSRVFLSSLFEGLSPRIKKGCDTNLHGEVRPCLSCGFCEDVCPVNLIPHLLFHQVQNDVIDELLINYKIFDCIDCNLCTYVCPSKIPLAKYIREGRDKLADEGLTCPEPVFPLKGVQK